MLQPHGQLGGVANYARRQQYRRVYRAGRFGVAGVAAAIFGLLVLAAGAVALGGLRLGFGLVLGFRARHRYALAGRSRVGAHAEDEVRRTLASLQGEGWRLRYALSWPGRGDIDSVAIAPAGVAFVIETKTRSYEDRHVVNVREQAAWLARRRRRWCQWGALGVLCVVRARGVERVERDVLVVSIDRLVPALRTVAIAGRNMGNAVVV